MARRAADFPRTTRERTEEDFPRRTRPGRTERDVRRTTEPTRFERVPSRGMRRGPADIMQAPLAGTEELEAVRERQYEELPYAQRIIRAGVNQDWGAIPELTNVPENSRFAERIQNRAELLSTLDYRKLFPTEYSRRKARDAILSMPGDAILSILTSEAISDEDALQTVMVFGAEKVRERLQEEQSSLPPKIQSEYQKLRKAGLNDREALKAASESAGATDEEYDKLLSAQLFGALEGEAAEQGFFDTLGRYDPIGWISEQLTQGWVSEQFFKVAELPKRGLDWLARESARRSGVAGAAAGAALGTATLGPAAAPVGAMALGAEKQGFVPSDATVGQVYAEHVAELDPDSLEYRLLSGSIDTTALIFADTFVFAGSAMKAARGQKAIRGMQHAMKWSDSTGFRRFTKWLEGVPKEQRAGHLSRAKEMFGWQVDDPRFFARVADADDAGQMRQAVLDSAREGWIYSLPTFPVYGKGREVLERAFDGRWNLLRSIHTNKMHPGRVEFDRNFRRFADDLLQDMPETDRHLSRILQAPDNAKTLRLRESVDEILGTWMEREGDGATRDIYERAVGLLSKSGNKNYWERSNSFISHMLDDGAVKPLYHPALDTQVQKYVDVPSYRDIIDLERAMKHVAKKDKLSLPQGVQNGLRQLAEGWHNFAIRVFITNPRLGLKIYGDEFTSLALEHSAGRNFVGQTFWDRVLPTTAPIADENIARKAAKAVEDMPPELFSAGARNIYFKQGKGGASSALRRAQSKAARETAEQYGVDWAVIDKSNTAYDIGVHHVINNQIFQSPLGRFAVRYSDDAERLPLMRQWLTETDEGQYFMSQVSNEELGPLRATQVRDIPEARFYHGTSRRFPDDAIQGDRYFDVGSGEQNLFGPGFYVTDDPGVALTYTKKGTGGNPAVHGIDLQRDINFLDLSRSLPDDAVSVFRGFVDNSLEPLDYPVEDMERLRRALDEGANGEAIYGNIREVLGGSELPRSEARELMDILRDQLTDIGYGGFRYTGGARLGGKQHNAYVVFDPADVRVRDTARVYKQGERKAEILANDAAGFVDYHVPKESFLFNRLARTERVDIEDIARHRDELPDKIYGPKIESMDSKNIVQRAAGGAEEKIWSLNSKIIDSVREKGYRAFAARKLDQLDQMNQSLRRMGLEEIPEQQQIRLARNHAWEKALRMENPLERGRLAARMNNLSLFIDQQLSFQKRWGRVALQNPGMVSQFRKLLPAAQNLGLAERNPETGTVSIHVPIDRSYWDWFFTEGGEHPSTKFMRSLVFRLGRTENLSGPSGWLNAPFQLAGQAFIPQVIPFAFQNDLSAAPAIEVPASIAMRFKPSWRQTIRMMLGEYAAMPTDEGSIADVVADGFAASWMRSGASALLGHEGDEIAASNYIDYMKWASLKAGDDSFFDPEKREEMQNNASNVIQVMTAFGALSRFAFPYALMPNQHTREAFEEYRETLDNAPSYEEGLKQWLDKHGAAGIPMTVSKSESVVESILGKDRARVVNMPPTDAGLKFLREHGEFVEKYPDVAGMFMVESEDDYNPDAFLEQVQRGFRESREAKRWLAMASVQAGSRVWYDELLPTIRTLEEAGEQEEADELREMWSQIHPTRFPGWEEYQEGGTKRNGARERALGQLREAVNDPAVRAREDVQPLKRFLGELDRAMQVVEEHPEYKTLKEPDAFEPLRAHLRETYNLLYEATESQPLRVAYEQLLRYQLDPLDDQIAEGRQ